MNHVVPTGTHLAEQIKEKERRLGKWEVVQSVPCVSELWRIATNFRTCGKDIGVDALGGEQGRSNTQHGFRP
jgi:hypothetical protein